MKKRKKNVKPKDIAKRMAREKKRRKVIVCDECGKEILLDAVKINKVNFILQGENVELKYFKCGGCDKTYRILWTNDKLRSMQEQYKNKMKELRELVSPTDEQIEEAVKLWERMNEESKSLSKSLDGRLPELMATINN